MCHMDALLCCPHTQCLCQQDTLYVKFIKNKVLKLHSCFNLRFVAPNQVQNPSTAVVYKQKVNNGEAEQESTLSSPSS